DEHLPRVLRQDRDAAGMREDSGQDAVLGERRLDAGHPARLAGAAEVVEEQSSGFLSVRREQTQSPGVLFYLEDLAADDAYRHPCPVPAWVPAPPERLAGLQGAGEVQPVRFRYPRRHR